MKKTLFSIALVCFLCVNIFSQNSGKIDKTASFAYNICVFKNNPIHNINLGIGAIVQKKWTSEITCGFSFYQKTDLIDTFKVSQPTISFLRFGWQNEYNIIEIQKFSLSCGLELAYFNVKYADKSLKESYVVRYVKSDRPLTISENKLFQVNPQLIEAILALRFLN